MAVKTAAAEHVDLKPSTAYRLNEELYGKELNLNAKTGAEVEQHLPPLQAIKAYKKAVFWSLVVSMCVIMEGYDTSLIGNFFAYPSFAKKYGEYFPGAGYQLTAAWQAGFSNATGVGSFFGVIANGYLVDIFGQKRVLIGALSALSGFIFIMFFAPNITVLTIGGFLCGLVCSVHRLYLLFCVY